MKSLTTNTALDSFLQAVIVTDAQRRQQFVTNEQDQMNIRMKDRSECCNALVNYDGLHTYCDRCGAPCKVQ